MVPALPGVNITPPLASARRPSSLTLFSKYLDRKSTRLNSSHVRISYAVFCLKKKIRVFYCPAPATWHRADEGYWMDTLYLSPARKVRATAPACPPDGATGQVRPRVSAELRTRCKTRKMRWVLVPLSLVLMWLGWQRVVAARNITSLLLPAPARVATRFVSAFSDGTWCTHFFF